jgi:hypothetical protein
MILALVFFPFAERRIVGGLSGAVRADLAITVLVAPV